MTDIVRDPYGNPLNRDKLITALRAENERLKTSGIAEVAAHNPSVMDYMRHWEGRAGKAEAENERLRAALREYECHCPTSVCEWFPCGKTARNALAAPMEKETE